MTNFEKFKADLTVEKLALLIEDSRFKDDCQYCFYYEWVTCPNRCEYGIKKWLESEAEGQ